MYVTDTILELKDPREDQEVKGQNGETSLVPFPYNKVRVIGTSPISHSGPGSKGDYEGADAQGVIIEPLSSFSGNLDEPFGKLTALYDVVSIPEPEEVEAGKVVIIDATSPQAGPTPEERFAKEAPGKPRDPNAGPVGSPLPDPEPPSRSPLGAAPSGAEGHVEVPA